MKKIVLSGFIFTLMCSPASAEQWLAAACGQDKNGGVVSAISQLFDAAKAAEEDAKKNCDETMEELGSKRKCVVALSWNHGCGYVVTGDKPPCFWGTNVASLLKQCKAAGIHDCNELGQCIP